MTSFTSGRVRSHSATLMALACCRARRVTSVRNPRRPRKQSSLDAVTPMSVHSRCSLGNVASLHTMSPSRTSEWPPMYLVAACTDTSTPKSNARKFNGVAHELSMMTNALRECATFAIAGTSCTSNVRDPGDSTKTIRVFGLNSRAMSAPSSGS